MFGKVKAYKNGANFLGHPVYCETDGDIVDLLSSENFCLKGTLTLKNIPLKINIYVK